MKNLFRSLFIITVLSGCVSTTNLRPTESFSLGQDEGVVVIGTSGTGDLTVLAGELTGDNFVPNDTESGFRGKSESGYYVRKLKALKSNEVYGLIEITRDNLSLTSCGKGSKIFAFNITPGKVTYMGNINIEYGQKTRNGVISRSRSDDLDKIASIKITKEFQKANEYFTNTYTNINMPLTEGELKSFTQKQCPSGYYSY